MTVRVIKTSGGGKDKIIWGIILTVMFGLATLGCVFSEDVEELFAPMIICAMVAMVGVSLIVKGIQMKNKTKSMPHPTHEFDADAPDFVKDRLNELMFEGKINGTASTTVSKTIKRVSYTGPDGVTHTTETITQTGTPVNASKSYRAGNVICEACGGVNKLRRGQSGICEFCGSHIQG